MANAVAVQEGKKERIRLCKAWRARKQRFSLQGRSEVIRERLCAAVAEFDLVHKAVLIGEERDTLYFQVDISKLSSAQTNGLTSDEAIGLAIMLVRRDLKEELRRLRAQFPTVNGKRRQQERRRGAQHLKQTRLRVLPPLTDSDTRTSFERINDRYAGRLAA